MPLNRSVEQQGGLSMEIILAWVKKSIHSSLISAQINHLRPELSGRMTDKKGSKWTYFSGFLSRKNASSRYRNWVTCACNFWRKFNSNKIVYYPHLISFRNYTPLTSTKRTLWCTKVQPLIFLKRREVGWLLFQCMPLSFVALVAKKWSQNPQMPNVLNWVLKCNFPCNHCLFLS